jgi:hypothetical protein
MLGLCLERLAPGRQSLSSDHYEVIVTDDGKTGDAETFSREDFIPDKELEATIREKAGSRNIVLSVGLLDKKNQTDAPTD